MADDAWSSPGSWSALDEDTGRAARRGGSVKVGVAREAAAEWVVRNAATEPWFRGAYFIGSTVALHGPAGIARWSSGSP